MLTEITQNCKKIKAVVFVNLGHMNFQSKVQIQACVVLDFIISKTR